MPRVDTALDLWDVLKSNKIFRATDYDVELVEQLCAHFGVPAGVSFDKYLQENSFSAQKLASAMLNSIEPFARMLNQLYSLYEKIGAKYADKENLKFAIALDSNEDGFEFDTGAFEEWERIYSTVKNDWLSWDIDAPWDLLRLISGTDGFPQRRSSKDEWTIVGLPFPESGDDEIDRVLAEVWELREAFLKRALDSGKSRAEFARAKLGDVGNYQGVLAHDYWDERAETVVRAASEAIRAGDLETARRLREAIPEIKSKLQDSVTVRVDTTILESLRKLLSLPLWGQRHDVYAAWVFTLIVDAVGFENLRFWVVDGRLSFNFSGAQLATYKSVEGDIDIWAELRSPHPAPIGKNRKRAIQPDFSITRDPVSHPNTTIAAIECKQHKRGQRRSNLEALQDYSSGLPNAKIMLVGYGPLGNGLVDEFEQPVSRRIGVFRDVTPMQPDACDGFKKDLEAVIPKALTAMPSTPSETL
ncbi:hypothetical protein HMPREF3145_07795 [Corynebacterium sp. HMSC05C01]|uniref:hypothetical protein n=1 Tax=Corynebacterium sp. HMSC05C01 TaxID=1581113 RepID=UPI0008A3B890|nr:hypothetical protein [Corynebacterium sp. HMSC05C01]OFT68998.1 hypothetical protein HMPREF3145_07795 [Corynebacterium sp. HMSC05C01]